MIVMNTPIRQQHVKDQTDEVSASARSLDIENVRARARCLQKDGNFDEAAQLWSEVLGKASDDLEAVNELGNVFLRLGQFEDALRWYVRALKIHPGLRSIQTTAGIALRQLHRCEEAISNFESVLASEPDNAIACFNLGASL